MCWFTLQITTGGRNGPAQSREPRTTSKSLLGLTGIHALEPSIATSQDALGSWMGSGVTWAGTGDSSMESGCPKWQLNLLHHNARPPISLFTKSIFTHKSRETPASPNVFGIHGYFPSNVQC